MKYCARHVIAVRVSDRVGELVSSSSLRLQYECSPNQGSIQLNTAQEMALLIGIVLESAITVYVTVYAEDLTKLNFIW